MYLVAILVILGAVAGLIASSHFAAKRRQKAAEERLRTAPIHDLASEVAHAVGLAGWGRLEPGAALQAADARTEKDLLDGLGALSDALIAEDREKDRSGRDSNYFDFHDFGLARISEALRARLEIPQPWDSV